MPQFMSDPEMFVYLSYLPKPEEVNLDWLDCDWDHDFGVGIEDESWWIEEGIKAVKAAMQKTISAAGPGVTHVLMMSGGLDSRGILGGLLENVPLGNIVTATYGIPGTWDFEVPRSISRRFHVRHEAFDLQQERWERDDLLKAAACLESPVRLHEFYVRHKIAEHFGENCVFWCGYFGDGLAAYSLPDVPATDRREALLRQFRYCATPGYKDAASLDKVIDWIIDCCAWENLQQRRCTLDLKLMYAFRQRQYIQPTVMPAGFTFRTPYLERGWLDYITNIPYKWLLGKRLYKQILGQAYPQLAGFALTTTFGTRVGATKGEMLLGKAWGHVLRYLDRRLPYRSHPRTNYINWPQELRRKSYLQESVYGAIQELKKRSIFDPNEIDGWWQDHLSGKADLYKLLTNLASTEMMLQAGVMS